MVLEQLHLTEKTPNKLNRNLSMKYLKKINIVFLVLLLITVKINGQNIKDDLVRVAQKMAQNNFKMNVQMKMVHWEESLPSTISKGIVKRKGNNYYTDFDNQINLINDKYTVIVAKEDKQIIYTEVSNADNTANPNEKITSLPENEEFYKNAKLLKSDKSGNIYEIKKPQFGMVKMVIHISKDDVLKEVVYHYEKNEHLPIKEITITYSNVVFNPAFSSTEFSEKFFLKKVNGKVVLTEAYSDYKLINPAQQQN